MILYEYQDRRGRGAYTNWRLGIPERARLEAKLDMLRKLESREAAENILHGIRGHGGLAKLKVRVRNVQLRPIFCYGPGNAMHELTFLLGAYERDWEWDPPDAPRKAWERKAEIEADGSRRRLVNDD